MTKLKAILLCIILAAAIIILYLYTAKDRQIIQEEARERIETIRAAYPPNTSLDEVRFNGERLEIINEAGIRVYLNSLSQVDGYKGFIYDIYNDNNFDVVFQTDGMEVNSLAGLGILYQTVPAKSNLTDVSLACANLALSDRIVIPYEFAFFYAVTNSKKNTDLIERKELVIVVEGIEKTKLDFSGDKSKGESLDVTVLYKDYNPDNQTHIFELLIENTTDAYVTIGQWKVNASEDTTARADDAEAIADNGHYHDDGSFHDGVHTEDDSFVSSLGEGWVAKSYRNTYDSIDEMAFLRPRGKGIVRIIYTELHSDGHIDLEFTSTPMFVAGSTVEYRSPGVACSIYPQSDEGVIIPCVH